MVRGIVRGMIMGECPPGGRGLSSPGNTSLTTEWWALEARPPLPRAHCTLFILGELHYTLGLGNKACISIMIQLPPVFFLHSAISTMNHQLYLDTSYKV